MNSEGTQPNNFFNRRILLMKMTLKGLAIIQVSLEWEEFTDKPATYGSFVVPYPFIMSF